MFLKIKTQDTCAIKTGIQTDVINYVHIHINPLKPLSHVKHATISDNKRKGKLIAVNTDYGVSQLTLR